MINYNKTFPLSQRHCFYQAELAAVRSLTATEPVREGYGEGAFVVLAARKLFR